MTVSSRSERIHLKPGRQTLRSDRGAVTRDGGVTPPPSFWLKGLIRDKIDLWIVSDCLNVNPSTIQKIWEGRRISWSVIKKVEAAFQEGRLPEVGSARYKSNRTTVERMLQVYHLYKKEGNLRAVGRKLDLSYERVRQLLQKGLEIGLFKYNPSKRPALSREQILRSYRSCLTLRRVAKVNRISINQVAQLLALHQVTKRDLDAIRLQEGRRRCQNQYLAFATSLGRHPTTSELLESKSTRSLARKIRRLWKSLEVFRSELNVRSGMHMEEQPPFSLSDVIYSDAPGRKLIDDDLLKRT